MCSQCSSHQSSEKDYIQNAMISSIKHLQVPNFQTCFCSLFKYFSRFRVPSTKKQSDSNKTLSTNSFHQTKNTLQETSFLQKSSYCQTSQLNSKCKKRPCHICRILTVYTSWTLRQYQRSVYNIPAFASVNARTVSMNAQNPPFSTMQSKLSKKKQHLPSNYAHQSSDVSKFSSTKKKYICSSNEACCFVTGHNVTFNL